MTNVESPVWLITGCSTGLGRALARLVLARQWRVIVTARHTFHIADLVHGAEENALALELDVTDRNQVADSVDAGHRRFGRIDVLVNNAGYGYQSSIEEGDEDEIHRQFDVNVFGIFALTRAVLPIMRRQRSGHIVNITSISGLMGLPGSGYYAASKHAIEGWSDSLRAEVAPLGIGVTCVEPGAFRTDWAGRSLKQTPTRIPDYADMVGKRLSATSSMSGHQPGDPIRAGEAIIALTQKPRPPRHLVLGAAGHDAVVRRLKQRLRDMEDQRDVSISVDFPAHH